MHTQMIKEVVPLAEEHSTVQVFTFKDLDKALGLWILVFVNLELSGPGYRLINL
jgi:hypothetical protein